MSNSEGDIDDELLALATGSSEKQHRKGRQGSSSKGKKRKAEVSSESEDLEPESEDDQANPYPLEGKYIDEYDREKLLDMNEMERETIISQRLEEMQKLVDKRNLESMLRENRGEGDTVAKAAKRQHAQRGVTKEKTKGLDELKARRRAKDDRKRTRTDSPRRDRSSSPVDMDMSDEEDEDGQITKYEEEDERVERRMRKDDPITKEILQSCWLPRSKLEAHAMTPWFEEYAKGSFVRYMVGHDKIEGPKYRVCEIINVVKGDKPYKIETETTDDWVDLKHGKSSKVFKMDLISNTPFSDREYDRWKITCDTDQVKLPSKSDLDRKHAQLQKHDSRTRTEADISAIINRRKGLNTVPSTQSITLERSRLYQSLNLAEKRQDFLEAADLRAQIQTLEASIAASSAPVLTEKKFDLALVNERNRQKNQEAIRKQEQAEAERKRKERKLRLEAGMGSGAATPVDSRVKGLGTPSSRPGTPTVKAKIVDSFTLSPSEGIAADSSFLATIDVDLGDF